MTVYLISDELGRRLPHAAAPTLDPDQVLASPIDDNVPDPKTLAAAKLVLIAAPLQSTDVALQLAGTLQLALEQGAVVVFAYHVRPEAADMSLLDGLLDVKTASSPSLSGVEPKLPAFREYLTAYGRSATAFHNVPNEAEVIATIPQDDGPDRATAFVTRVGQGAFYVVPYHRVEALPNLLPELFRAVTSHRETDEQLAPAFLDSLVLPGEPDVRNDIERLRSELDSRRSELGQLVRFKHLVGFTSGAPFEQLTIDALNLIFGDGEYRAVDRDETFEEDFWIVRQENDFALAEAKGINTGVGRQEVNKVDDHRAALDLPHEFPGLLVVSTARMSSELRDRQQAVHHNIVQHGRRQNVLIVRGWDLYGLVSIAIQGGDAVEHLVKALNDGGGWLEAAEGNVTHHIS